MNKLLKKLFRLKRFILLFTLLTLSFAVFFSFNWWSTNTSPMSSNAQPITVIIPKGKSAGEVGQMLYQKDLIRNPLAFKLYVQFFDKTKKINAGEFELSPSMGLQQIVEKLGKGPLEVWITVPEGLRKEEIVERFIAGLERNIMEEDTFREDFLNSTKDLEGYLFPDTYLLPKNASTSAVIRIMSNTFNKKVDEQIRSEIEKSGRTLNEVITLASIIERETKTNEEKAIVAGILWKRLDSPGWLIQADASVQYAIANAKCKNLPAGRQVLNAKCGNWWPILTKEDLEINSLYNTYKYKTLPPTPIASPGITSIEAAANPAPSDYWFYIHDPQGVIHYAKTISEHNSNIAKYLGK